jgi:glucokinase
MIAGEDSQPKVAIGIDVGGTKSAAGLIRIADGRVLARRLQPTRADRGGEPLLTDIVELAHSIQQEAVELGIQPMALGLGVAELVSADGLILSDATICWRGLAVGKILNEKTGLPVQVDADVRAAAWGEAQFGAGRTFHSFVYITVGTGISASFVFDRTPYVGARGLTGTFASGPSLIPGADGQLAAGLPLEEFAAGPALATRLQTVSVNFAGTAHDVIRLSENGDAAAREVVVSAGQALGAAVAQLVNVLDPEAVVIGGGLGMVEGDYRRTVEQALRDHVWSDLHRGIPLLSAELGVDAGLIGAAHGACLRVMAAPHQP